MICFHNTNIKMATILFPILLILLATFYCPTQTSAADYYVSDAAQGTANGSDCDNSYADGATAWAATSAGDTIYLCGTFTNQLVINDAGSDPTYIYIKPDSVDTPDLQGGIKVSGVSYGWLYIQDLNITGGGKVISIRNGAHDIVLDNLSAKGLSGAYFGSDDVGDTDPDNITIKNSTVHNVASECIYAIRADNLTILDNILYDCGDGGGQGDAVDVKFGCSNLIVDGNTIYTPDAQGDNIQAVINMRSSGGIIRNNYIYNLSASQTVIRVGSSYYAGLNITSAFSGTQIYNNLVLANGNNFINVVNVNNAGATVDDIDIYNNTVIDPGHFITIANSLTDANDPRDLDIRNNIVYSPSGYFIDSNVNLSITTVITTSDYNDIFSTGDIVKDKEGIGGCSAMTYAEWSDGTCETFDTNSITDDPSLDGNYKPGKNDPVVNTGTSLAGIFTTDKEGATRTIWWDMGAFRYFPAPENFSIIK